MIWWFQLKKVVYLSLTGLSWVDRLLKAGEVAREVRAEVPELVVPGTRLLEVAERVEAMIRERGCMPAFPCNVSIDAVAAHYSPPPGDVSVIPKNSVVKVDFGVVVDGFIADTAITVTDSAEGELLKKAVEEALKAAVKVVAANVKVSEVGAVIQNALSRFGVKPIRNLTGHEIQRFNLHAGVSIPNVAVGDGSRLLEGHVYAIEPFATLANGAGEVVDRQPATIFKLENPRPLGSFTDDEKNLLKMIENRFNRLPYSLRWLRDVAEDVDVIHQKLVKNGRVKGYPLLVERSGKPVGQAEHTILVEKDGCILIT